MGNKTGQPLPAKATKEPGAIHWMEAKPVQRRGIADVMQERRRDQRVTILGREGRRHATRLAIGLWGWTLIRWTRVSLPAGVSRALAWAKRPPMSAVPSDSPHLSRRPHLTSTTSMGRTASLAT
jgi:hypothetical protein